MPWGFSAYWQDSRMKNQCSVYFRETDLDLFEIVLSSTPVRMKRAVSEHVPLHQ
ncbi:MAG: hypothetical protein M3Z35_06100 [Nitrospirota bacterium]|nr:hypothetical protein [Nitrospirota bacterium]